MVAIAFGTFVCGGFLGFIVGFLFGVAWRHWWR